MRTSSKAFIATLCASAILTTSAVWAANAAPTKEANAAPQDAAADKDLAKFSADGANGFEAMALTRRAIFEGRIEDAKKFVALADADFTKAKADDSVYTKAEADLKPPPTKDAAAPAPAQSVAKEAEMKAPIAWVPVDGSISIAEDITGNTAKSAAVDDANKSLQSGDRDAAVKKLKVAGVEVAIVLAVMPIDMTIDKVHQAAVMIDAGKYYEGSQELRLAQANERFV